MKHDKQLHDKYDFLLREFGYDKLFLEKGKFLGPNGVSERLFSNISM